MRIHTPDSAHGLIASLLLAALAALPGCSSDDGPPSPDASVPGPGVPDAGPGSPDASPGPVDAGPGPVDAAPVDGMPAIDGGVLGEGAVTLAGGALPGSADGPRDVASFDNPVNVLLGPDGNLYVADFGNDLVRVITPAGEVSTLVEQTGFRRPFGMLFGADGALYVQTDANDTGGLSTGTGTIWRVDLDAGAATVVARNLGRPRGIAQLDDGRLVLADGPRHSVYLLDLDAAAPAPTLLAGSNDPQSFGHVDGVGTEARFNRPQDVVVIDNEIYMTDRENHRVRKITVDGVVTTVAGSGAAGSNDGPMSQATFNRPYGLAHDGAGNLYVSETAGYRIRQIDTASGMVTTVAGTGEPGHLDTEDPMAAMFFGLEGIDVDAESGYLYAADGCRGEDEPYHRIRRVTLE